MTGTTKVTVDIYGHDYTITGEKPQEEIQRVASHVDEVMNEIAAAIGGGPISSIAVLAAVNIADELYDIQTRAFGFDDEKERMKVDLEHCKQLLENAKNEFQRYKLSMTEVTERKATMEKTIEAMKREKAEYEKRETELTRQLEQLKARGDDSPASPQRVRELEDRCKEVEGNYFEIQMENIRLKGDLERYRREDA